MEPVTVYLGLGSNLDRREDNLAEAIRLLGAGPAGGGPGNGTPLGDIQVRRVSSVYQTTPWGYTDQPDFLNCVLEARTTLSPDHLLEGVKGVERSVGRQPSVRYGPRRIDVDILLYGDDVVDRPELQIPHPRLHQRAFVLVPLAELRPGLVHPILRTRIDVLASQIDGREGVVLWGFDPSGPVDNHPGLSHS